MGEDVPKLDMRNCLKQLQDHILVMHEHFLTMDVTDLPKLLASYRSLDEIHDLVTDMGKQLGSLKTTQQYQVLPKQFETLKVDSLRSAGRNFILNRRFAASLVNKPLGFSWLRDRGYGAAITEGVQAASLSSLVKEHIETRAEEPTAEEDGIKTSKTPYVSMRKT